MTEKLILMHENTPYFNFFSFFETFRGGGHPPAPRAKQAWKKQAKREAPCREIL